MFELKKLVCFVCCLNGLINCDALLFEELASNNRFKDSSESQSICEPIQGECADQGYAYTSSAKLITDGSRFSNQQAADATIKSFNIMLPCSNYFKNFLCGTYK